MTARGLSGACLATHRLRRGEDERFHRRTRDFTFNSLRDAMIEVIACFPIYRTYATCTPEILTERDRGSINQATRAAVRRNPASDPGAFAFLREMLLLDAAKAREESLRLRDEGNLGGAAAILRDMSVLLAAAPAEYGDVASGDRRTDRIIHAAQPPDGRNRSRIGSRRT